MKKRIFILTVIAALLLAVLPVSVSAQDTELTLAEHGYLFTLLVRHKRSQMARIKMHKVKLAQRG